MLTAMRRPDSPGQGGRRRAILIATSTYGEPTLPDLPAVHNDYESMAVTFGPRGPGGFEIVPLPENPAKDAVLKHIERVFVTDARADDVNLIYISGHGQLDTGKSLWFPLRESRKEHLRATYLDARWIKDVLEDSKVSRQLVIVDTCHSRYLLSGKGPGAGGVSFDEIREAQHECLVADQDIDPFPGAACRCFIFACGAYRQAFADDLGRGRHHLSLLTSAVVATVTDGSADRDGNGLVTADELWTTVRQHSRRWDDQRPEWEVRGGGETSGLVVARVPAQPPARGVSRVSAAADEGQAIRSLRSARRGYRRRARWQRHRRLVSVLAGLVLAAASLATAGLADRKAPTTTQVDLSAGKWQHINTDGTAALTTLPGGTMKLSVPPGNLTWYAYYYAAPSLCDYTLEFQARHDGIPADPRATGWGYGISLASTWDATTQTGDGWIFQDEFSRVKGTVYSDDRITSLANPNARPYPAFGVVLDSAWHSWKFVVGHGLVTVSKDGTSLGEYPLADTCGGILLRVWSESAEFRAVRLSETT